MSDTDRIDVTFFKPRGLFKKAIGTHVGEDGKPRTTIFWLGRDHHHAMEHAGLILRTQARFREEGLIDKHWTPETLIRVKQGVKSLEEVHRQSGGRTENSHRGRCTGYQAIAPDVVMVGKTLDELWPKSAARLGEICRRVLATGVPHVAVDELNMIRRTTDGPLEAAYFSWSMFRVRLPGDEGWGILNTAWETTASKVAELACAKASCDFARWPTPSRNWHGPPRRADGFIEWYNQGWYDYTGTMPKDMEGWGWQSVHDPLTLPLVMERWKVAIQSGEPFEMAFPLAARTALRTFLTRVSPLVDERVAWCSGSEPIPTSRISSAEEAHTALAAIVESSDDAILSKRLDGTILTWNAAAERLFGYRARDIVGTSISQLVPPERTEEEAGIIARLRRGEECEHIEDALPETGGLMCR